MKTIRYAIVVLALIATTHSTLAAGASDSHSFAVGLRQHAQHEAFEELPFDDGDIGYTFAYEYGNEDAYWQMMIDYVQDPGLNDSIDYVVTPQINLIMRDGIWRAGIGGLMSYFEGDDYDGDDWTDLYWQVMFGLGMPLGRLDLNVYAHYVFEAWDEFDEFETDEIEYSAALTLKF